MSKTIDSQRPRAINKHSSQAHLDWLEAEAVYVMREAAAQFENPVLMFSGGKDSITMVHLARRAFYPARVPFPLLHVDTGHNFPETIEFRDNLVEEFDLDLIVRRVQDTIDAGRVKEETGEEASRNKLQIVTLKDALDEFEFDVAIGGARRDEEKARAKERFFSHRDRFSQWDPKNQRPELWNLYNGMKEHGEHFRAFPISNWTELDVWQYLRREDIAIPNLYMAHEREVVSRNGTFLAKSKFLELADDETYETKMVRFRTIGDMTCTGAFLSDAETLDEVVEEVAAARSTERGDVLMICALKQLWKSASAKDIFSGW